MSEVYDAETRILLRDTRTYCGNYVRPQEKLPATAFVEVCIRRSEKTIRDGISERKYIGTETKFRKVFRLSR